MPDGSVGYPESVLLRLLDSKNGPHVQLAAWEDGSGRERTIQPWM